MFPRKGSRDSREQPPLDVPKLVPLDRLRKQGRVLSGWSTKQQAVIMNWEPCRLKCHVKRSLLNSRYMYVDINPDQQIRVLELLPSVRHQDPIIGRFAVHDLDSIETYEAISHSWGRWVVGGSISCDGAPLEITKSVSDALRRFRRPDCVRRLWIDSICINQSNKLEKDSQVKHMRQIYANAQATLVWIGEEDSTTLLAFHTLNRANRMLCDSEKCSLALPSTFDRLRARGLFSIGTKDWQAVVKLVDGRQWFTRCWTLQEVGLASKVILQCGSFSCDFYDLHRLSWAIWMAAAFTYLDVSSLSRVSLIGSIVSQQAHGDGTLWQLLQLTSAHAVSDPRDKVYALLGLARNGDEFTHLVDYDKSVQTLYLEVFQHHLVRGQYGLLNQAGRAGWQIGSRLPSWLPDWSTTYNPINLISHVSLHPQLCLKTAPPSISSDGRTLYIRGFVLDHVTKIRLNSNPVVGFRKAPILKRWRRLATRNKTYPTGERSIDAFARTMVLNNPLALTSTRASPGELFDAAHTRLRQQRRRARQQDTTTTTTPVATARDAETIVYLECMRRSHSRLTFFVTHAGYMGLGCFFLHPGDILVELQGGVTPYAIRPRRDGTFSFLGEAYVHGKMHLPESLDEQRIREFKLV